MTITFTPAGGGGYSPSLEGDLGTVFDISGEAATVAFQDSVETTSITVIELDGGDVSVTEVGSIPVLTLTTP